MKRLPLSLIFFISTLFFCAYLVFAQELPEGAGEEISFGKYSVPVLIWVVMSIIYRIWYTFPNRAKVPVAVLVGMVLGVLFIEYSGDVYTFKNVVDHILFGMMAGLTSSGLYETVNRAALRPRE